MPLSAFPQTAEALAAQWPSLAAPGDWWTGAERVSLIEETRNARSCVLCAERKDAVSPYAVARSHEGNGVLPAAAVDAVHRVSTDPGRLSSRWFEECQQAGLEAAAVVELGGLVSTVQLADTLAIALDQELLPVPEAQAGEPTRTLPAGLSIRGGWAPMVEPEQAEGVYKTFFENLERRAGFVYNVVRALSASPTAWSGFFQTFLPNYATDGPMPEGGLTRVQVELLASSTSAFNDCFY